ncbi:MAG: 3-phosphoshikimate 1-carboxyvinyltransferase [Candidatus Omnitrophota bacterium]
MPTIRISPAERIRGGIEVPGDKSISQRAILIGSIAEGTTIAHNILIGEDCARAIDACRALGIEIEEVVTANNKKPKLAISGKGLQGLTKPARDLYLGNSGTSMRLAMGILAGQGFDTVLRGDASLSRRPMKRVALPLRMMGARITRAATAGDAGNRRTRSDLYPPLRIKGSYPLRAVRYTMPVASAQVKSAILLAGLYARGRTEIIEPIRSRDHTERMLRSFGLQVTVTKAGVSVESGRLKSPGNIRIPGDISSAAYFMVAALILKSSRVTVRNVGINPTRTGILTILRKMGADIQIKSHPMTGGRYEPVADITARSSRLRGVLIGPEIMPRLIDELPAIMVAAALARGVTVIRGASELRVKETDRIVSMSTNLRGMGADIELEGDTIVIRGVGELHGAYVKSFGDHRTAMSMAIAALAARGKTVIADTACIRKSYPGFEDDLRNLLC